MNSPVVQRQRLLAYNQATMVQLHPGLLMNAQVRQLAERLGLNPRDCEVRLPLWARYGSVGNWQTTLA